MPKDDIVDELIKQNLLTQEDLSRAKQEAEKRREPLEEILLDLRLISKEDYNGIVADRLGTVYVELANYLPDPGLKEAVPEELCRRYNFVPLFKIKDTITIAISDPLNLLAIDQIAMRLNAIVECVFSTLEEIRVALDRFYGHSIATEELIDKIGVASLEKGKGVLEEATTTESPIANLVELIIAQAVRDRASDIHVEPEDKFLRIRYRVDGILYEIPSPPKELELAIISRVKLLAGMDIAENRLPQDGHFQQKVDNQLIDLRVATLPTINGENVVMRLLDTTSVLLGLEKLGFSEGTLKRFEELILRPYGIILSTGPTGSGKTTTLYSSLMRINSLDRNIVTIEDPVEYRLGLIRQTQINVKAGITFANGLRHILRQDPDVIMVGEIRDLETAIIAVQASLTGHLVFSTIHTNDASSTVIRMINMGVEPYLVSAAVSGIIAQRLVREICSDCKEPYEPAKALVDRLGLKARGKVVFYHGKGCNNCKGTGYRGRTGIYELMILDDELKDMIIQNSTLTALRNKACEKGMKLLREEGLEKVLKGITTWDEVLRVTEERVEIRPAAVELPTRLERIPTAEPTTPPKLAEVKVNPAFVQDYQKKISDWLSKK